MPLPQQFNPYIPQQELNKALEQYKQNPRSFTPQDINTLKDHARYYNIPFAEDEEKHQNTLGGLLSQAGQGFLEGFTTFDMFKDPPKDEWESISRNIGHLAGFVGFIPSAPFKLLGMKTLAQGAKKARGWSIPMIAAKKAQEAAGKLVAPALKNAVNARAGAVNTAAKFINDSPVIQDLITGGFHLGVASAASTWTKGVDEMMASFIGGAQTGAAFRFIGNMVKTDSELANKVIRGLSASLYQGMHATMAGATTPEQVYEYLLGAYFGVKEMPYHRRKAGKHLNEMAKKNETDPEVVKGWEDLDKKTQDYAKEVANKTYGVTEENLALGYKVAKEAGINVEQQQEYAENYAKELSKLQRLPSDVTSLETSTEKEKTQREVIKELETESSTIEAQRDLDVGSSLVDLPQSSYQIKNFTLKTLRESIESAKNPEKRLADYSFDIENKWESLLSESRQKSILDGSPPENPADSMVNYFKTKYNKELNQTDSSYWRSLGNRKLKQVKVPMLTWENGRIKEIEDVDIAPGVFPSNRAGNKKLLLEEPKVLDKVYQDLTGDPNASAYSVLDHAVVRTRKGYEEITLNQLGERKIEEDMSSFHVNNIVDMHAKGQYYFGGRGDAARHYYVKYHPSVEATNAGLNKQINEIFKNSPIKLKDYKEAYEDFISKNPIEDKNLAAEVFKKSFISNIYYDINVNGLSVSPKSIKTMFDDGFINNAKAFNKRAQIWFTSGLSSNKNFINSSLLNSKVPLADNQQYRVKLVEDSKEVLHTDGAIIGHPDVIKAMNLDYGLPTEGNTVKSFIVSPNKEYGALLGKYMIHRASDPVKEYMEKTGVHMIIPRSSAKQFGLRGSKLKGKRVLGEITTDKFGNVYLKGNNKQTKDYFVDPSHLKGIFSEKNDKHAMDDVSLPKQMQSNLTPYTYSTSLLQGKEREAHVQKNAEVIEDMYNTLSSKSFEGDPAINSKVRMLMANPYKNEYLLKEINENFESIGIKHLIDGIKAPGNEKFANLAYNKMQRANEEFVKSLVEDGEMTLSEAETFRAEVGEQLKVHDKLMQLSNDSLAGIFHKFSRDYRVNSTRNYIITRLTKPKVGNSFTIKMRPYDEGLKIRKDEIGPTIKLGKKEGERLFFLDDGFKEYKIKSESFKDLLGKEESTLGEVWDLYRKKKFGANQEKVKEVLRTTLTRVPMDSMSGAHVLEFGGFTGIKGYGGLLHPKTMDALGGADLDGDKAFGFFGSEKYGFKKDWKDLYHKQKNENKGDTADSLKDEYRSLFTVEQETDAFINPKQQYFPNTRFDISKAAYEGRMSLGPTVINRATLNAAWSTIMGSKKKSYEYEGELVDGSMVRIKPLTDDANMQLFRKKARAAISFASDPMDEGGLRSKEVFWDSLAKHLFKWEVFDGKTNKPLKNITKKYNDFENIKFNRYRRQGLVKLMSDINSKLYGKNNIEGKRWTFYEINDTMRLIDTVEAGGRNTLLTKLADTMKDINYSDGVLSRVNFKKLIEMYDKHEGNVNNLRWLRDLLGRSTLRVNQGNLIDFIRKHRLHTPEGMREATEVGSKKWIKIEEELLKTKKTPEGDVFFYDAMNQLMNPVRTLSNPKRRKYLLDKLVKQGEDFIVNDISDIASIEMLSKYGKEVKNSPLIQDIIKEVEYIKRMNYLMARKASVSRDISQIQALSPGEKKVLLEAEQILGKGQVDISKLKSQAEIDARIIKFKEDKALTPEEKLFMDSLLLGSINRGYKDVISNLDSAVKSEQNKGNYVPSRFFEYEYNNLKKNADNTTVARIGFISSAVNEGVLKDYMKSYSELWDKSTGITPKVKTRVMQEVDLSDKDRPILDAKGNRIEATTLETPERDRLNNQYLDEAKPFEGLHNGTLKGEAKDIYYSIKGHLNHYNNKVGKELNGVVREIVGKDLNSMNLEDWRTVDRYFKEIRNGTWYQRLFDKIKTDYPEIKKRYYHMFPEAINRDMLRYDMELMKVRRPYLDKQGKERIGEALKPTGVIDILQNYVHGAQENATRVSENQRKLLKEKLKPYIDSIPEGRGLYRMAVRIREYEGFKNENFDYKKYLIEESEKQGWDKLKDKKFGILIGDKRTPMTGREIVNKINDIITEQNKIVHKWLTGDKEKLERYLALDDGTHNGLVRLKNEFLKDLREASAKNEPLDIGLGIDGLNKISKKILMSQVPKIHRKRAQKELRKKFEVEDTDTNDLGVERYFPHVNFDRGQARKRLLESIEKVLDDKTLETRERETTVQRLIHHYKQMTGDWVSKDEMGDRWNELSTHLKNMADKKEASKDYIKWYKSQIKVGNQYSRSKEPIPGWDVDPEAYDFYMKNIVDSYYRATSQIASRTLINDWSGDFYSKSGNNARLTNAWRDFLNLYVQDSMGYPSQIPKSVLNNPDMKLKGTPYAWMADSNVLDRVNKIAAKLGIRQRKDLPGELKGFGHKDLSAWTNLEAKYQLASLLAHPKSSIANIYGGTAMTVVNTGWHNFRNARKIEYLRNTINSKWNRMQDVEDWVTSHGVIEEFLRYEADINPVVKGEKWNRFFDDAMAKIRKDPNMSDTTLRELGTKHKLTDRMFNAAASFMRVPERILRRDSFVAHYLQAKERFAGAITELNDPYLIEMAKKGVKSTQFLYSAPFRPAFSRSALGKVMTRFQLWSWNSVKFRNEVLREAKIRGFRTGTPEFEKFKRLAIADLFSLGLANVFMYSLFESALPAPWNWFQDTSDLMFGDDKERERAFFGAYPYPFQPLQMVTPPALRALPPLFKGIVTDDYSKLADYTIWSMFPFGRLAKDVVGPGGVIENPVYGVEKLTGIPYIQFVKQFKQKDKEE